MVPYCEDCRTSTSATGCPKHSGITFHNRYAGFSLDDDEPLVPPGREQPIRGHRMVPEPELQAARALADELAEALEGVTWRCNPTAGGADGRWCVEHNARWTAGDCEVGRAARAALAKWEASK